MVMRRYLAIFLAILLLSSNLGFSANIHYCGGRAVKSNISIGESNLGCGMESSPGKCEEAIRADDQFQQKNCCSDQHHSLQVEEELDQKKVSAKQEPDFNDLVFSSASYQLYSHSVDQYFFFDHPPPAQKIDLQLKHQVFLI